MMLVDNWLAKQGAQDGCTRIDVRAAIEYLTNPVLTRAIYADATKGAMIVWPVTAPPLASPMICELRGNRLDKEPSVGQA